MTHTLAHDVRFSVDLPPSLAQERFYGEESSTVESDIQPINYQSGNAQLFLQDLLVRGGLAAADDPISFRIRWKDPETEEAKEQIVTTTVGEALKQAPADIYKARALMAWTDMAAAYASASNTACTSLYSAWEEQIKAAGADQELAWLDGLTDRVCGAGGAWARIRAAEMTASPIISGSVVIGAMTITGAPSSVATEMEATVRRSLARFRSCYSMAQEKTPHADGRVRLRATVNAGRITEATAVGSNVNEPLLQQCSIRMARLIGFSPQHSGKIIFDVDYRK